MLRLAMNRVSAFIYNLGDIKVVEFSTVLSTLMSSVTYLGIDFPSCFSFSSEAMMFFSLREEIKNFPLSYLWWR